MRPPAYERARAYLTKAAPRSIAGQNGDNTAFTVACMLVVDFALSDGDARALFAEYNRAKCDPPWNDHNVERFVRSARKVANSKPSEVGKLLDQDRKDYDGPRSPVNKGAAQIAQHNALSGSPRREISARTARTPFFKVSRFGERAEPRTPRTVRTLLSYSNPISQETVSPKVIGCEKEVSGVSGQPASPVAKAVKPAFADDRKRSPESDWGAVIGGLTGKRLVVFDALMEGKRAREGVHDEELRWLHDRWLVWWDDGKARWRAHTISEARELWERESTKATVPVPALEKAKALPAVKNLTLGGI